MTIRESKIMELEEEIKMVYQHLARLEQEVFKLKKEEKELVPVWPKEQ